MLQTSKQRVNIGEDFNIILLLIVTLTNLKRFFLLKFYISTVSNKKSVSY